MCRKYSSQTLLFNIFLCGKMFFSKLYKYFYGNIPIKTMSYLYYLYTNIRFINKPRKYVFPSGNVLLLYTYILCSAFIAIKSQKKIDFLFSYKTYCNHVFLLYIKYILLCSVYEHLKINNTDKIQSKSVSTLKIWHKIVFRMCGR